MHEMMLHVAVVHVHVSKCMLYSCNWKGEGVIDNEYLFFIIKDPCKECHCWVVKYIFISKCVTFTGFLFIKSGISIM